MSNPDDTYLSTMLFLLFCTRSAVSEVTGSNVLCIVLILMCCLCYRGEMERAQFLSGPQETEAETETAATVMATPTVFTLCQSAVPQRMATYPGTQRPVRQHLPPLTLVGQGERDK